MRASSLPDVSVLLQAKIAISQELSVMVMPNQKKKMLSLLREHCDEFLVFWAHQLLLSQKEQRFYVGKNRSRCMLLLNRQPNTAKGLQVRNSI